MRKYKLGSVLIFTLILLSCSSSSPQPIQTVLETIMISQPPLVITPTPHLIIETLSPIIPTVVSQTETIASTFTPGPYLCGDMNAIGWDEARYFEGQNVSVFGEVVDTNYASSSNGQPTFLNIGKAYPDPERFTVLFWINNRDKFPPSPEDYYLGKSICVSGYIELYEGVPEIEITDPSQILIP